MISGISTINLMAQSTDNQEFKIPLSNPAQPGKLIAKLHRGSIKVEGHSGKDVIITIVRSQEEDKKSNASYSNLRRIPNTSAQFNITEDNNIVKIQDVENKRTDFEIKVPNDFSLSIHTHHYGYIEVNNVTGEIEVSGHHDNIILNNIGGSVIAGTHHGKIKVTFQSVTPNTPMAFSTYHGDIDITFPASVNGSAKIKTTKGEIYTDFDMEMKVKSTRIESGTSKGTKIQAGGWLTGDLGSGGPEFMFSTYRGDVILRKK